MFPDATNQQQTTDPAVSNNDGFSTPPVTDPYASPSPALAPAPPYMPPSSPPPAPSSDGAFSSSSPAPSTPAEPAQSSTDQALDDFLSDSGGPSFLDDKPAETLTPAPSNPSPATPVDTSALGDMKQQAITQLQPLVDHLDQDAEDQFKTTMMLIQATDDHRLLKKAFDTAQKIEDDKARAQALLDVINEINYFTQNQE